jgi:hypothetical protein
MAGSPDQERHQIQGELSRVLLAADAGVDAHRLVTVCCERPDSETLSISLLVPLACAGETRPNRGAARAALLRRSSMLFDSAGLRLEDFVLADDDADALDDLVGSGEFDSVLICTAGEDASSPVLPLVARLARLHGLAVVESRRHVRDRHGWFRRMVHPQRGN